jgi:hypothetical protein
VEFLPLALFQVQPIKVLLLLLYPEYLLLLLQTLLLLRPLLLVELHLQRLLLLMLPIEQMLALNCQITCLSFLPLQSLLQGRRLRCMQRSRLHRRTGGRRPRLDDNSILVVICADRRCTQGRAWW